MAEIFVSYARKESDLVRQIMLELHSLGLDYWMDTRNLQGGYDWPGKITTAILGCKKFLLFMSAASMASDNVRREVQLAYEEGKTIIILRLEQVEIPETLKYQLAGIQWIDYSRPDWESRITIALTSRTKRSHVKPHPKTFKDKLKSLKPQEQRKIATFLLVVILSFVSLYIYLKLTTCVYKSFAKTDPEAITWLIENEAQAVVSEDMGLIKAIFTEDAIIVDAAANGGTPQRWTNPIDRYESLFEDFDFLVAENTHIKATGPINNDTVEYISGSIGNFTDKGIPGEYKNRDDSSHWTAKKIDGCWKIIKFEFNLH